MLPRPNLHASVRAALARSPAVALVGPRQVGKTTLARSLAEGVETHWFDLVKDINFNPIPSQLSVRADLQGVAGSHNRVLAI